MYKKFILVLLVLGLAGAASADDWFKGSVDDDWHNPSNWGGGTVPDITDATFNDGDFDWAYQFGTKTAKVYSGNAAEVGNYFSGNPWDNLLMDLQLVVESGASFYSAGVIQLSSLADGSIPGLLDQEGGFIRCATLSLIGSNSAPRATLEGGNLHANTLVMATGAGVIDIHNGTLILNGDWRVDDLPNGKNLNQLIGNGDIFGWHGASPGLNISYNVGNDTTTITAQVPEPTTIALLGLGGLALLRRRR